MTDATVLAIAGVVTPIVMQIIKTLYKSASGQDMSAKLALNLMYLLAIVFAVVAKLLNGTLVLPAGATEEVVANVVTQLTAVIGLATVIYKSLISGTTSVFASGQA